MKKSLLKPPAEDGRILCFLENSSQNNLLSGKIITAHQIGFLTAGVTLKFLFLERFKEQEKEIFFLDTEPTTFTIKVPTSSGAYPFIFLNSSSLLFNFSTPEKSYLRNFLLRVEEAIFTLKNFLNDKDFKLCKDNFNFFCSIFLKYSKKKLLKEVLALTFLEYFSLDIPWRFLSEVLKQKIFEKFYKEILERQEEFRCLFNALLDEYKETFKFRYKNFPFPKLQEEELPFWLIKGEKRRRCFLKDLKKDFFLSPRACALSLFLRGYLGDIFIHGVGGANYDWVADRLFERFFHQTSSPYWVISGTFYLNNFRERNFPYFLYSPYFLRDKISSHFNQLNIY